MAEIVEDIGGSTSNSYVTVDEYRVYLDEMYGIGESEVEEASATSSLIRSARRMDQIYWLGWKSDGAQSLSWPRKNVVDPDMPPTSVVYLDDAAIPVRIKRAQMELAYSYSSGFTDEGESISEYALDGLSVKKSPSKLTNGLPKSVNLLIFPLMAPSSVIRN